MKFFLGTSDKQIEEKTMGIEIQPRIFIMSGSQSRRDIVDMPSKQAESIPRMEKSLVPHLQQMPQICVRCTSEELGGTSTDTFLITSTPIIDILSVEDVMPQKFFERLHKTAQNLIAHWFSIRTYAPLEYKPQEVVLSFYRLARKVTEKDKLVRSGINLDGFSPSGFPRYDMRNDSLIGQLRYKDSEIFGLKRKNMFTFFKLIGDIFYRDMLTILTGLAQNNWETESSTE